MSEPIIRVARRADAAKLTKFAERLFRVTFGPDNRAEDMDDYTGAAFTIEGTRDALDDPDAAVLVAECDGRYAGYVQMRRGVAPLQVPGTRPIEIERFYVDPQWQGSGLAQRLMQAALDEAVNRMADQVWLGVWERNGRAIAFYRKQGFREVGAQLFMLGADRQRDLVMARELA